MFSTTYLPNNKLLVGECGGGQWLTWSQTTKPFLCKFSVLRDARVHHLAEDDKRAYLLSGSGCYNGIEDGPKTPLTCHDLRTGILVWRRKDLLVQPSYTGLLEGVPVIVAVSNIGAYFVELHTGKRVSGTEKMVTRPPKAQLPRGWSKPEASPVQMTRYVYRSPTQNPERHQSPEEKNMQAAAAKEIFKHQATWTDTDGEFLEISSLVQQLLARLAFVEGRGHIANVKRSSVAECIAQLGPLPDDILALFAAASPWLQNQHQIHPSNLTTLRERFVAGRIPNSLLPFGHDNNRTLCVFNTEQGLSVGSCKTGSYRHLGPLCHWLSETIWNLADKAKEADHEKLCLQLSQSDPPTRTEPGEIQEGSLVQHVKFGYGTVVQILESEVLEIQFVDAVRKLKRRFVTLN